ncbi:glutathione S-transferase family protein [Microcoleus sp. FACHB-53]|nr:glutathione S-transferase family protein [Microcoleus sp. FACHB-53]
MLKLYHIPLSANSRRVWITLLEKSLSFEEVILKLDGDQYQEEFLKLNPFHHIPVLVDDDFRVVESLAILDYLEAKYPTPSLMPTDAKAIATVRMVELVTINELLPPTIRLTSQALGVLENEAEKLEKAHQKVLSVLTFFESLLGDSPYFGSEFLTLGDIAAGTVVPQLPSMGVSLDDYPKIQAWSERLMARDSWQKTQPSPEAIAASLPQIKALMKAYLM